MEEFELKSVDRIVLAAKEECLEHGRRTGEEMGILIRNGEIWIRQMGGADSVNFARFSQEIMRVRDDGAKLVLVHNHPQPVMPLSGADWNFASGLGKNGEVWAVGEDGGMFRGKGKGDGWKWFKSAVDWLWQNSRYEWSNTLGFDNERILQHLAALALAKNGRLEYQFKPGTELVNSARRLRMEKECELCGETQSMEEG